MKAKLKAFLKNNRFFYLVYFYVCSYFLRCLGLFIKTDPNLILFISYGGKKYDDSPRVVYEYLLKNPVSPDHHYVWAFVNPEQYPQVENRVRVDTLTYFLTAMKAGYWITNSSASRGLNFKKDSTKNIMFEHGMVGLKKIGVDVEQQQKAFRSAFAEKFDLIFLEGKYEIPILSNAWKRSEKIFRQTGLPRNDDLVNVQPEEVAQIKQRLGIPKDKKVILYAPTFREFVRTADGMNGLHIPMNWDKWKEKLGNEYILLFQTHYEVTKLLGDVSENGFLYNVCDYPVLNDLLKVTDILVSDYSSIVFDYSILERPILCYAYDYEEYVRERGLYTDVNELFFHGVLRTEDEVIEAIRTMDYDEQCRYTREKIRDEYLAAYGNSAQRAVAEIFNL